MRWRCKYCSRLCLSTEGGADELPDGCDQCWAIADAVDMSGWDFAFLPQMIPVHTGF